MLLKIGFATNSGGFKPIAWTIRLLEWIPYSHTYFRCTSNQEDSVFQIVIAAKAKPEPASQFLNDYKTYREYQFQLNAEQEKIFFDFCDKHKNTKYSMKGLIGNWVARTFCLKTNPFINPKEDVGFCTKMLMEFMLLMPELFTGVKELKRDPTTIGLKEIYNFISKHPKATRVL